MIHNWFFDLDGTLARTGEDIRLAWLAALRQLGRDTTHFDEVFSIGPTLEKVTYDLYPDATPELVADLLKAFKPLYDESGFPNTEPYVGVPEMLQTLKASGAKLYIVTNKRHAPTQRIAVKFGWDRLFDGIWSYDSLEVKYAKPELLARLLKDLNVNPQQAVMVGDTRGDVNSGRVNGLRTIGVTYGYGVREELAEADWIVDSWPTSTLAEELCGDR